MLPWVALAIWGGSYAYALALTLSAPERSLEFRYQSPGGVLKLTAQSYAFDFRGGNLWIRRPVIADPSGRRLASADYVEAKNIYATPGNGRMDIRATTISAKLERLQNGSIPIFDYLPRASEQPSNVPFRIAIQKIQADVLDQAGASPWSTHLSSPSILVEGKGNEWVASGEAMVGGMGALGFQIEGVGKNAYRGDIQSSRLVLGELYRHLSTAPEGAKLPVLRDFSIQHLVANGPFSFRIQPGKRFAFETSIDLSGSGVAYRNEPRAQQARFVGYLSSEGLSGVLTASNETANGRYEGSMSWLKGIELGGDLQAKASSRTALGPSVRKLIPVGVTFDRAEYHGWLGYSQSNGWNARGAAHAAKVSYGEDSILVPSLETDLGGNVESVVVKSASWHGAPISGEVTLNRANKGLRGVVRAASLPLNAIASRFHFEGLEGQGDAEGLLTGTLEKPIVDLQAKGDGSYRSPSGNEYRVTFEAAGQVEGQTLHLARAVVRSEAGNLSAQGDIGLKDKKLMVDVVGAGVRPGAFSPDLDGNGGLIAQITGTLEHPLLKGRAEVFSGRFKEWSLPVLAADISADRQRISATNLRAVSGASEAVGSLDVDLKSKALAGAFEAKGVQVSDLIKNGPSGTLDISRATIGGTLQHPSAKAEVVGTSIVASDVKVDSVSASVTLDDSNVSASDVKASIADGQLAGAGSYDLQAKSGKFDATASKLQLGKLLTSLGAKGAVFAGSLSGKATVALDEQGVRSANGSGDINDVVLNQTPIGSGPWTFTTVGKDVQGSVQIGYLDRFIEIANLNYGVDNKRLSADLNLLNVDLSDAVRASAPFMANVAPETQERLRAIDGSLVAHASLSGVWPDVDLKIPSLGVEAIKYNERPFGSLNASLARKGTNWTIDNLNWRDGESSLNVHGNVDEKANLSLDGELSRFDLTNLAFFNQRLGALSGSADVSFLASGPTISPEITASLKSDRFDIGSSGKQMEFGLLIDSIHLTESKTQPDGTTTGGIIADGGFTYRGLSGRVSGRIPFKYPFEIPAGAELTAQIELPERSLASLSAFYSGIDAKRTVGTVAGAVRVFGPVDGLKAEGSLNADAESFALSNVRSALTGAKGSVQFKNDVLDIGFSGKSTSGGDASLNATTRLQDFGKLIALIAEGNEQELLDAQITGKAKLNRFRIEEGAKDSGTIDTTIDSDLTLQGTIGEPAIKGTVALAGADVLLPGKPMDQTGMPRYLIDPSFDVTLTIADSAKVRTSTASLDIVGNGKLSGTLSQPNLTAAMVVTSGTLRLPTARVAIEPDGTLNLTYIAGEEGQLNARMDVDIQGTTAVTTLLYGDTIQRYDILLHVQGDLFKEGGLNLTATSDPPDLSQDRILALLGQADVLQAFTGSVPSQEAQKQIRTALTGVGLPLLLDPVTSKLATSIGLQYLNIEYNAYEQATFAFGKVLGKGLILQGRRQLSEPVVGTRPTFDLRISYRLPVKKGVLSRTTLSFGADQDRPWKIAVEYGTRF